MKYFFVLILFLTSCAKPTVVQVKQDTDYNLTCDELSLAIAETIKFKSDAEYTREATGANMTRAMLFWPAMLGTQLNSDKAVKAASDRIYHLQVLGMKKKCIDRISVKETGILAQLKELRRMLESGELTEDEYNIAKKHALDEKTR